MTGWLNSKNKGIAVAIVLLILIGGIVWFVWPKHPSGSDNDVACTQEAKLCPDGSYVDRTGPDCEFAACPDASSTPNDGNGLWRTMTDASSGVTFSYPATLTTSTRLPSTGRRKWPCSIKRSVARRRETNIPRPDERYAERWTTAHIA